MKKILKKMISKRNRKAILTSKHRFQKKIIKEAAKSRFLASVYYIFSSEFDREHQTVLKGKIKYSEDLDSMSANHYLLRRNIHRLEKGLLMKPMRKIFAVKYIEETVKCYERLILNSTNDKQEEIKWAHDVLQQYFEVTGSHNIIDKMRIKFKSLAVPKITYSEKHIPYVRDFESTALLSYDELMKLAKFRRSTRWFENKKVSRELIDNAINVASLSPSACNRQPFRFQVFDDENLVKELSSMPMGTGGYSQNIPVLIAVIGDLSAYPFEKDRHLIYIDSSLATMSLVYGLEVQGISSCIINWPDIDRLENQISDFLALAEHERVVMLVALGHPDKKEKVAYSQKKQLSEIRSYNL